MVKTHGFPLDFPLNQSIDYEFPIAKWWIPNSLAGGTHRLVRPEAAHRALPSAVDPNGARHFAGGVQRLKKQGALPSLNGFVWKCRVNIPNETAIW